MQYELAPHLVDNRPEIALLDRLYPFALNFQRPEEYQHQRTWFLSSYFSSLIGVAAKKNTIALGIPNNPEQYKLFAAFYQTRWHGAYVIQRSNYDRYLFLVAQLTQPEVKATQFISVALDMSEPLTDPNNRAIKTITKQGDFYLVARDFENACVDRLRNSQELRLECRIANRCFWEKVDFTVP